jgi:signal transduction histidine kinase
VRRSWVTRQVLALALLATLLVVVSGFLELTRSVHLAFHQSKVEAGLVTGGVRRTLARLAAERPEASLHAIAADTRLQTVLTDAIALAPSVLAVALVAPDGTVAAHTDSAQVGAIDPPHPPLPETIGFRASLETLWRIRRTAPTYEVATPLALGSQPFATVRVAIGGTFIWDAVRAAASRGMLTAVVVLSITVAVGIALARFATGRFRVIEAGIHALREGRFDSRVPESGYDEFSRLARALNLLGERFGAQNPAAGTTPDGGDGPPPDAAGASRVLGEVGRLASGVAHELRNHLQVVDLELESLKGPARLDAEELERRVSTAAGAIRDVERIVRGFLKIAGVRPPAPERVRVHALLAQVRDELDAESAAAGVELLLEPDPGLPETLLDPEMLKQALHNLVRNAIQALAEAGRGGRVWLGARRSGATLSITVADDGPGIPADVLARAFDLYFTTRPDGSGVGLALVRQAAELHGGKVEIESRDGSGARVTMEVPWRERW